MTNETTSNSRNMTPKGIVVTMIYRLCDFMVDVTEYSEEAEKRLDEAVKNGMSVDEIKEEADGVFNDLKKMLQDYHDNFRAELENDK